MKNDIVKLKGEEAKTIAEVAVSTGGERPVVVRICQLIPSGIFVVLRNSFAQGTFGDKERAAELFLSIIQDEAV